MDKAVLTPTTTFIIMGMAAFILAKGIIMDMVVTIRGMGSTMAIAAIILGMGSIMAIAATTLCTASTMAMAVLIIDKYDVDLNSKVTYIDQMKVFFSWLTGIGVFIRRMKTVLRDG